MITIMETYTVGPSCTWRDGEPCPTCSITKKGPERGIVVNSEQSCAWCGWQPDDWTGYGQDQTGTVTYAVQREANSIRHNPALNPHKDDSLERIALDECQEAWMEQDLTDDAHGHRFALLYRDRIKYSTGLGWLIWDGTRWRRDDSGTAERYTVRFADLFRLVIKNANLDGKEEIRWLKAAEAIKDVAGRKRVLEAASTDVVLRARPEDFDRHYDTLTTPQGLVHLPSGLDQPHDPREMSTRCTRVSPDPNMDTPVFDQFMEEITCGDQELRDYILRAMGYTLTGQTSEHCLFFAYGSGANGKSTLIEFMGWLMDDYGTSAPFDDLLKGRNSNPVERVVVDWPGIRFLFAEEAGQSGRFNVELLKVVTSGGRLTARQLYKEKYTFTPTLKMWIAANERPRITGQDEGTWRRFRMIPFEAHFPPEKTDKFMGERLQAEAPGILYKLIQEARLYYETGSLPACRAVEKATAEYRGQEDVLKIFLEEVCDVEPDARGQFFTSRSRLRDEFNQWARQAGLGRKTPQAFGAMMRQAGYEAEKNRGGIWGYYSIFIPESDGWRS